MQCWLVGACACVCMWVGVCVCCADSPVREQGGAVLQHTRDVPLLLAACVPSGQDQASSSHFGRGTYVCALDDLAQPIALHTHSLLSSLMHNTEPSYTAPNLAQHVWWLSRACICLHVVCGARTLTYKHTLSLTSSPDATATADAVVTIVSQVLDGDRMAESLYQIHFRGQRKPAAHSSNHDLFYCVAT